MNYFGKTIVLSLVVALVSFAGSFCLHPMAVEAASADDGGCISESSNEISNIVVCTSDCVTTAPQAVATKKTSADSILNVLATVSQAEQYQFFKSSFNPLDATGTPPLSPDILSSVVKIE